MMTPAQRQTLKTAIQADSGANAFFSIGDNTGLAAYLNALASPAYWIWRTRVSRAEIYNSASPTGSLWDWTIYKSQSVPEQNAFVQMFMGDSADFSQLNLREGIGKIFGASNAQTLHCLAVGRRQATRFEKVFASGAGSTAAPSTLALGDNGLALESPVSDSELQNL